MCQGHGNFPDVEILHQNFVMKCNHICRGMEHGNVQSKEQIIRNNFNKSRKKAKKQLTQVAKKLKNVGKLLANVGQLSGSTFGAGGKHNSVCLA